MSATNDPSAGGTSGTSGSGGTAGAGGTGHEFDAEQARALLELHWLPDGYAMPNQATYPWQWLWDSCFHAIVWAELGDERCLVELEQLFAFQAQSGFVPHMSYHPDPDAGRELWGRHGSSTITQPPMYGHAIVELARRGFEVAPHVVDNAVAGLRFLLTKRKRTPAGLVSLVHPWESGCDDSARWDDALAVHGFDEYRLDDWRKLKVSLLSQVEVDSFGAALANPGFMVGSAGFNALVAFNAAELATVANDPGLADAASELSEIVTNQWDPELRTWCDDGMFSHGSGRARTADAHYCLLVDRTPEHTAAAAADLVDPTAFGASFGPRGAHVDEPTYDPDTYWRGPAWPQSSYLLWQGCKRAGEAAVAAEISATTFAGVNASGMAEYWNPENGEGRGAIPQSWATIALAMR